MADKVEEQPLDRNEAVRQLLRRFLRLLGWLLPIVILGYFAWMAFFGSDPRRQLDSPESVINAYNALVMPFVPPSQGVPTRQDVDYWLTFFTDEWRDFFRNNERALASRMFLDEAEEMAGMSQEDIRRHAMRFMVSRPPLSGIGNIVAQYPGDGEVRITVGTMRSRDRVDIVMKKSGPTWVFSNMGPDTLDSLKRQVQ